MGWDGGEGNSRGRRFAGIVNVNCGEEERREGEGDLYGGGGESVGVVLMRSSGEAPLNRFRR